MMNQRLWIGDLYGENAIKLMLLLNALMLEIMLEVLNVRGLN